MMELSTRALVHRATVVSSVAVSVVGLVLLAWTLRSVVPLVFGGALVAALLIGLARAIARRTPLGYGASLAAGGLSIVALLAGAGWFVGDGIVNQLSGIGEALPAGLERAEALLRQTARAIGADEVPPVADAMPSVSELMRRALGVLGTAAGALASVGLLLLFGIFLASNPAAYRGGLLRLVPPPRRARAGEVLSAVVRAVRKWLVARFLIMTLTFFMTWGGLTLIGVPFAAGLAVLSALVVFVPYVGPYISGALAVLVALIEGPQLALYTALFYLGLENLQGWTVEPLIESRLTAAPPALLLGGQIVFGLLLGVPGFVLASPLMVALTVLVQMLYVQDVLGDRSVEVLGESGRGSDEAEACG